ncbi:hypothetical protein [Natronorubrum sp. FCH18a]|uniref:hypothetical protein n=1 Tax=Natronorubrum sp. FCH18a TaxID=3447018 RepID=UPI003F50E37A
MGYDALADRLASDDAERCVTTLPDGSVDTYYTAFDERGDRITDRETFGNRIASAESAPVPLERDSREPGGQAVNMARQAHALGDETTLFGHLEDPVFADLPFETVSMGEPTRIDVFPFDDDGLLFSEQSADVETWSLADLEAARPSGDPHDTLAADAICCGNWASIEGLTEALSTLAAGPLAADVFVLDPGPVRTRSREAVADLLAALGRLDETVDVVYSINREELEYTAEAVDERSESSGDTVNRDDNDALERLATVRETAGITAAALHASDIAAVATRAGETVVENLSVDEPRRRTGAGDRFSAALGVARARDWDWRPTLALGNCCAAHYVETSETADRNELRTVLERAR